jgi:acyl CoA:acetate/3-ketoacid CoA transferase alpha subunit
MADKVKTVAEVVQSIPDGSHIALGGFAINRCCVVVSHELIRQQKKNLTLSQGVVGFDTDLLVGAGLVNRLIMGGGSLDRFGPVHCVNRAREKSRTFADDYSSLTICFKYLAGALGLSFMPTKSLLSSEVLERLESGPGAKDISRMKCPFTGEEYLLLKALSPDVSFVHVQIADREGNSQISGATWENEEQAKAGRRVVVIAEEIVPTEYIQRNPEATIIPGHRVEAVIHQPFGAHPSAVFRCYDYDAEHLKLYVNHSKRAETFPDYVKNYITGTRDHWEYLEKVGGLKVMNDLKADRILGY